MSKRLSQNLNSDYIEAMNRLRGKNARKKIVAYVESFSDVFFWSNLLRSLETDEYYFEVMLPSRNNICKGKKSVLANKLGQHLGNYMIACVDADYDYLMQGATLSSKQLCGNPYVFHTYVYAIENFQCYGPALHNVCVMCTLNDRRLFDFADFLTKFSETIWPLFVWNIWAYRYDHFKQFTMADFFNIVEMRQLDYYHPENTLDALRKRVNGKIARLQQKYPDGKKSYKSLAEELQRLGVTPQTTYLYMRGHDLFDGIVAPMLQGVCDALRKEREKEIRRLAVHAQQQQNEMASYEHSIASVSEMLQKHTGYYDCPEYRKVQKRVRKFLKGLPSKKSGDVGAEGDKVADA